MTIRTPKAETPDPAGGTGDEPVRSAAEEEAYRAACRRYARLSGRRR